MASIQQSIDVGVPAHVAYHQLLQFEDYPRFMQDVETVHRLDDTHLHWSAKMSYQPLEWDSEIVEQIPGRCIAWRNAGGPMQSGKLELQPVGDSRARVTMTVECDPAQVPAERSGNPVRMVALRVEDDLARFKQFVEERDAEDAQQQPRTQSPASLSQAAPEDDGRHAIAEEQNFDQQSDQARRVGQMPLDFDAPVPGETSPPDAMGKAVLKQSIERAVPSSE